ncbi:DctP family TRAP transporter solute-binding subunit [Comamonas nitrativorans]|uniref:DctP family TRAP transporter solute-binding subunit n=1 Tax=Comamonas nitrativorans TaxID=108437 RepID=A0ABV9GV55_9BURK
MNDANPLRRRCLQALVCAPWVRTASARPLVLRLSHVVKEATPKGVALQQFAQQLDAVSKGRMQVQIFANARLYSDLDEMQALQLGAVDMLAPSLSKFGRIGFPEFELFDLPFLFETHAQVHRTMQGRVGQALLAALQRQRLVGLGYLDNGFKHMSANRALLEPQDFVGQRMRVQGSRVIAHQMRVLGAQPVELDFAQTRRALALGVVDGTENPVSNFWTQQMHEAQTDLSLTRHGYLGYCLVVHQRFWQHLQPQQRGWMQQALRVALDWGNAMAQQQNERDLAALRATGATRIHHPGDRQREQLRQALQPVYEGLAQRIGGQWVQAMLKDRGKP